MLLRFLNLISFIFVLNVLADYMYNEYCINDYYFKSGKFYYIRSDNNRTYSKSSFYKYHFDDGYIYDSDNKVCKKKPILQLLQISNNAYHSLVAFVAILVGFTFLFFSIYIVVDVAKK